MRKKYQNQSGFTLIELLIAIVVFSIGTIGVASMQGRSMEFMREAEYTGAVAEISDELIALIRARVTQGLAGRNSYENRMDDTESVIETGQQSNTSNTSHIGMNLKFILTKLSIYSSIKPDAKLCPTATGYAQDMHCVARSVANFLPDGKIDSFKYTQITSVDNFLPYEVELTISWLPRFSSEDETSEQDAWAEAGSFDKTSGRRTYTMRFIP